MPNQQNKPTINGFRQIIFNINGFYNTFPAIRLNTEEVKLLKTLSGSTSHVDMTSWLELSDTVVEGVTKPNWHPYGYRMLADAREALKSYKGRDSWFFKYMQGQISQLDVWLYFAECSFIEGDDIA